NSFQGMCLTCKGRGNILDLKWDLLIPNKNTTLRQVIQNAGVLTTFRTKIIRAEEIYNFSVDTPYYKLPPEIHDIFLYGLYPDRPQKSRLNIVDMLKRRHTLGQKGANLVDVKKCPECNGYRIGEDARRTFLNQKHIGHLGFMTITELNDFLHNWKKTEISAVGKTILQKIFEKIDHLLKIGLSYLTLYREVPSLSAGELQRLSLMNHLDSKINSISYIFDEPTMGLHEIEKSNIISRLKKLKNLGNSVFIIEHDKKFIKESDEIIDFGPLAGKEGGEVIYQGDYEGLLKSTKSITGKYLSGELKFPKKIPEEFIEITESTPKLKILNANIYNLKDLNVDIPLNVITGLCGVSGSGKSSLIAHTLIPLLKNYFRYRKSSDKGLIEKSKKPENVPILEGIHHLDGFLEVYQEPIGRHRNSNILTYTKTWEKVRRLYVNQPESKKNGYRMGHFSFNSIGACSECRGSGFKRVWLGSIYVSYICPVCEGRKFKEEVLKIRYKGKNIVDVLDMSVSEGKTFFKDKKAIFRMLSILERIGMGYLTLGQPTFSLSGGESQRVKIAKELGRNKKGHILYILDEPSSGLSMYDVAKLLSLLRELVNKGNSVIVIEHDLDTLQFCDWLIELGPEGGPNGGYIIAEGSPIDLIKNKSSVIAPFLTLSEE
ncbi:MAG: excinuclease ABC subunit UvrA, partial [Promethearchaeota archaeon]